MKFNYYNVSSRILLSIFCIGPFLGSALFFMTIGNILTVVLGIVMLFLFVVFMYKCCFMNVTIDEKGVLYKSLFQEKLLKWEEVKDVLIVVRERRSIPDYYKLSEWLDAGKMGKSYFVLFRTTEGFPENPMFMFSAPVGQEYISVQFRKGVETAIRNNYLNK